MLVKFLVFATIMSVLTVFLFFTFGQYRTGSTDGYSAVFTDASRLKSGDTVRVAGIRVGTVTDVSLQSDRKVLVDFDADRGLKLTSGDGRASRCRPGRVRFAGGRRVGSAGVGRPGTRSAARVHVPQLRRGRFHDERRASDAGLP